MSARPHFLSPLLHTKGHEHALRDSRTGHVVASHIELTVDSKSRRRGLLGRDSFAVDSVMIIAPCNAVHTFFMRFTIDVVFADRRGQVLKVCRGLGPWRVGIALGAFAALEFAAGSADRLGIARGDRLEVALRK